MQAKQPTVSQPILFEPIVKARDQVTDTALSPKAKLWIDEQLRSDLYPSTAQKHSWAQMCGVSMKKIINHIAAARRRKVRAQMNEAAPSGAATQPAMSRSMSRPYPSISERTIAKSKILFNFPDETVTKLIQLYDIDPDASNDMMDEYASLLEIEPEKVARWFGFRRKTMESSMSPTPTATPTFAPPPYQSAPSFSPRSPTIAVKYEEATGDDENESNQVPEDDDQLSSEDMDIDEDDDPIASKHYGLSGIRIVQNTVDPSVSMATHASSTLTHESGISQQWVSTSDPQPPHAAVPFPKANTPRIASETPSFASPTPTREPSPASSEDIPLADLRDLREDSLDYVSRVSRYSGDRDRRSSSLADLESKPTLCHSNTKMDVSGDLVFADNMASPLNHQPSTGASPSIGDANKGCRVDITTQGPQDSIIRHNTPPLPSASGSPDPSNDLVSIPHPVVGFFSRLRTIATDIPKDNDLPSVEDEHLTVEERFQIHNSRVEQMRSILARYKQAPHNSVQRDVSNSV